MTVNGASFTCFELEMLISQHPLGKTSREKMFLRAISNGFPWRYAWELISTFLRPPKKVRNRQKQLDGPIMYMRLYMYRPNGLF